MESVKAQDKNNKKDNHKTALDNQWVSTGKNLSDNRERRDGPGGEESNNKE